MTSSRSNTVTIQPMVNSVAPRRAWTPFRRRSCRSSATSIRQMPGTISLGQGVVHYGPPPAAIEAARAAAERPTTHDTTADGLVRRSSSASRQAARRERHRRPRGRRVMVTAGANMAFMHAVLAITEPGDEIILPVPFYFNHEMAIQMAGCRAVARADRRPAISSTSTPSGARSPIGRAPSSPSRRTTRAAPSSHEASLRELNALCRERGHVPHHRRGVRVLHLRRRRHVSPGSFAGRRRPHDLACIRCRRPTASPAGASDTWCTPDAPRAGDGEDPGHDPDLPADRRRSRRALAAMEVGRAYCEPHVASSRRSARSSSRRAVAARPLARRAAGRRRVLLPAEGRTRTSIRWRSPNG